jgi:hypothetical protein
VKCVVCMYCVLNCPIVQRSSIVGNTPRKFKLCRYMGSGTPDLCQSDPTTLHHHMTHHTMYCGPA